MLTKEGGTGRLRNVVYCIFIRASGDTWKLYGRYHSFWDAKRAAEQLVDKVGNANIFIGKQVDHKVILVAG
jgi:hypothetical protein